MKPCTRTRITEGIAKGFNLPRCRLGATIVAALAVVPAATSDATLPTTLKSSRDANAGKFDHGLDHADLNLAANYQADINYIAGAQKLDDKTGQPVKGTTTHTGYHVQFDLDGKEIASYVSRDQYRHPTNVDINGTDHQVALQGDPGSGDADISVKNQNRGGVLDAKNVVNIQANAGAAGS